MKGRKPVPREVLKLRNSSALRQEQNKREIPEPVDGKVECPSYLDAEAKRCWKRITKELEQMRILRRCDYESLAAIAMNWSIYRRSMKALENVGVDDTSVESERIWRRVRDSWTLCSRLLAEFGLTPSSRSRIDVGIAAGKKKQTDFEQFIGANTA